MNFATTVVAFLLLAFAVPVSQAADKKQAATDSWPTQRPIRRVSIEDAERLDREGAFGEGSMAPKVRAHHGSTPVCNLLPSWRVLSSGHGLRACAM